jgi:hypothetical protein
VGLDVSSAPFPICVENDDHHNEDNYYSQDVWYKIVGTGRDITISLCDSAEPWDSYLYVYPGPLGNSPGSESLRATTSVRHHPHECTAIVHENDDSCPHRADGTHSYFSQLTIPHSMMHKAYFIRVAGYDDEDKGPFVLTVDFGKVSLVPLCKKL